MIANDGQWFDEEMLKSFRSLNTVEKEPDNCCGVKSLRKPFTNPSLLPDDRFISTFQQPFNS
jgi:hypothetical protein